MRLSEFSSPKQYSRNSIPLPFPSSCPTSLKICPDPQAAADKLGLPQANLTEQQREMRIVKNIGLFGGVVGVITGSDEARLQVSIICSLTVFREPSTMTRDRNLRAKSRDSYRRIASESYRCDSNRQRSLAVISLPETQKLVLTDPAFVVLRFESRDWRSFV